MSYFSNVIDLEQAHLRGRAESFSASQAQCHSIKQAFELLDLKSFTVRFNTELLINGAYELSGTIEAVVTQPSAVSCEAVTTRISEPFAIMLVPTQQRLNDYEESHPESDCDVFVDGEYDIGNLALEYLSLSLPSRPRLPGESGDYIEFEVDANEEKPSPFAALIEKIKDK